ncbi:MAG: phosphate ABC transporter permease subunit PstC [Dermatophilaceae bacterium]|nr:phosphate ABC transporter permease subunit PstC [Dermatophilaceae bacterium]NUR80607.1 phosphate ABC transporter permease subunit PstC [Dermatophilaceae bacterium]
MSPSSLAPHEAAPQGTSLTTYLPSHRSEGAEDFPRTLSTSRTGSDRAFRMSATAIGASVLAVTGGIGLFLAFQSVPTLRRYGFSFFTESQWQPEADVLGISAVLVGTVSIAGVALFFAFPLALATALYISEYAPPRMRGVLVSLVDLMAAVPSIVYGLWGFFLIQPYAAGVARFLQAHFGWVPFFQVGTDPDGVPVDATRYTASSFIAGIAVAMMVTPMICAVMRQVFSQTPPGEKEAALALGSTRWGMIRTVVLPFGRGGIIGGTMLGMGRALGETIAVLLIISPAFEIKWRVLEIGGNSISSLIAGRFGDASPAQLSALLTAGLVLFVMTLVVNTLAAMIVARSRSGADADA